jgi:antitoxin (DNA-binding transcriptional repressor) of toxin-antitoxin stability system
MANAATIRINSKAVRNKVGELLNLVYYGGSQVKITRHKKVVARLVGEPLMRAFEELLDSDPGLAETLAALADKEIREVVLGSVGKAAQGQRRPADQSPDEV